MIFGPPAAPAVNTGLPEESKTIVGLMLDKGRLPGAIELFSAPTSLNAFGTPGMTAKSSISLFKTTPVPGTMIFEPNDVFIVAVIATQLPCESAAAMWVVCRPNTSCFQLGGQPGAATSIACCGLIRAANSFA